MRARLFISAAAAACLVWPAASWADQQPGPGPGDKDHPGHPAQGHAPGQQAPAVNRGGRVTPGATPGAPSGRQVQTRAAPAAQAPAAATGAARSALGRGPGAGTARGPAAGTLGAQVQPGQPRLGQAPSRGGQAQRQAGPSRAPAGPAVIRGAPNVPNIQAQPSQPRFGQAPARGGQTARRPPNLPQLGDWNRALRGPDRDQAGQQWRQGHRGWDTNAPWRRDNNWWRGNSAFRLFLGPRIGYFFIPEMGYVAVPPQYQRGYWIQGGYLPSWFWRYVVRDYWNYGLPQPPDGCIWVWVDNDVALIDPSDGYILDIVHNVW